MSPRRVLVIGWTNLLRLMRDRIGLFFIFVFPVIIIVALGLQFGGGFAPRVGALAPEGDDAAAELLGALAGQEPQGWRVERYADAGALTDAVERGIVDVAILLPDDYDTALRSGEPVVIGFLAPDTDVSRARRASIEAAVSEQAATVRAARLARDEAGIGLGEAMEIATSLSAGLPPIRVELRTVGESIFPAELGGFGLGAHSQLVLFMFLTSMTGASQLILSRQLGVSRRMLSTPTTMPTILLGEAFGRFAVAMVQGLFIVVGTAIAFGVTWGDPLAAGAIVVLFAMVASGAAMLVGAVGANAEQAASVGVFAGLGLGAIGGAMAPPEIFPGFMQVVSRFTPHRWAIDGLRETVAGGGLTDVLPRVGVLAAFAVVLLGLATWRLRVALSS